MTWTIVVCVFLSGLAGLVYEVVWARQLALFLGTTSMAHTAVVSVYMGGLAAGSYVFGKLADRCDKPFSVYAWLEAGIGLFAVTTPWLFGALQSLYAEVAGVAGTEGPFGDLSRFGIALAALLLPTFLMGGTLPLLVRGVVADLPDTGQATGRFYGVNTLGAVMGALLAGYVLLPGLGARMTIFIAVTVNLAIALTVLAVFGRSQTFRRHQRGGASFGDPSSSFPAAEVGGRDRHLVLAGFGLAGFAALLTQMAWLKALVLVVGGSVYAFTVTLASFLAGIGLGSLLYSGFLAERLHRLRRSWPGWLLGTASMLAALTSLSLLAGLPLIGRLPAWFLAGYGAGLKDHFFGFQAFMLGACFSLMLIPTLLMGMLFPLVTEICTRHFARVGRGVGRVYAVNTAGTMLGASLGGLFILPWLGVHDAIRLAAGFYVLVALLFWFTGGVPVKRGVRFAAAAVMVMCVSFSGWAVPPWDRALMVSGVFQTPAQFLQQLPSSDLRQIVARNTLKYYREGRDGIVAVRVRDDSRALVINGKTDASNKDDLPTQVLLAQLPLSLDRVYGRALVIGLGSGITAGSLAVSDELNELTVLEISPEVVEAARHFAGDNHGVLENSKLRLVTADARNYLLATDQRFDLVISEPSNPWLTGVSNLFTDEFIKLAKSRLVPGGVMTQWFHTYGMSNDDLRAMLRTFNDNFEYVSAWAPLFEDLVIIGSDQPYAIDLGFADRPGNAGRIGELRRAGINSKRDLARLYLFGGELLTRYVEGATVNSDDLPVIEFSAPKYMFLDTTRKNLENIFEFLAGRWNMLPITGLVEASETGLAATFMDLEIRSGPLGGVMNPSASWLISQLLQRRDGLKLYGEIGSRRVLEWSEGAVRFRLEANWLEAAPAGLPETALVGLQHEAGEVVLAGGARAHWATWSKSGSAAPLLRMRWACPAVSVGVTDFLLDAELHGIAMEDARLLPAALAARLRCGRGAF